MNGNRSFHPAHLALFLPDLCRGGVARVTLNLAAELIGQGHRVDLVLCSAQGPYLEDVPESVSIVELRRSPWSLAYLLARAPRDALALLLFSLLQRGFFLTIPCLPALIRYLRQDRPAAMLSAKWLANLVALWASRAPGVTTRIVISERTHLPSEFTNQLASRLLFGMIGRNYGRAAARVANSNGTADALSRCAEVPRQEIVTIYNGVVNADLLGKCQDPFEHPWFQPNSPPVILAAGRLDPQKDFALLLRAFALVRKERPTRLMILGEGLQRKNLEALANRLGIASDLQLPGWVHDPVRYLVHSTVFACSSAWEGFGNAIVEALAAGCPVVSTDCPSGPAEILDGGSYGRLVPVNNAEALAEALLITIDQSPCRGTEEKAIARARYFTTARAADQYLEVLLGDRHGCPPVAGELCGANQRRPSSRINLTTKKRALSVRKILYAERLRNLRDLALALPIAVASLMRHDRFVDCYVLFVGYPRSGSTLLGACLNSHPEVVIANESYVLRRLTPKTTKRNLVSLIVVWDRIVRFLTQYHNFGYSYAVEGQWQGKFRRLTAVGDKKCRRNTRHLYKDPSTLDLLRQLGRGWKLRALFLHRNPYDMIATQYLSSLRDQNTDGQVPSAPMWNESLSHFNPKTTKETPKLDAMHVEDYLTQSTYVEKVLSMLTEDEILAVRHEDFVARPKEKLREICGFLGLECTERYLDVCASHVFSAPHQTRRKVQWTWKQLADVADATEKYPWFNGYTYD